MQEATAMHQLHWGPAGAVSASSGAVQVVTDGAGVVARYHLGAGKGAAWVEGADGTRAAIVRPGRVLARAGWSRRVLRGDAGDLAGLEVGPGALGTAWTEDGRRFTLRGRHGTWEVLAPEAGVVVRVGPGSVAVAAQARGDFLPLALLLLDLVCLPPDATRSWRADEDRPLAGRRAVLTS